MFALDNSRKCDKRQMNKAQKTPLPSLIFVANDEPKHKHSW